MDCERSLLCCPLVQWVDQASHVHRRCPGCSGPWFKSRPWVLCCMSFPLSPILFPAVLSIKAKQKKMVSALNKGRKKKLEEMASVCDHHVMMNRSSWNHFICHSCSFFKLNLKCSETCHIYKNQQKHFCHHWQYQSLQPHINRSSTCTNKNTHIHTNTLLHAITTSQSPSATFQSAFILMSKQPSCLPPRWIAITNPFGLGYHQLALAPNPIPPFPQAPTLSLAQSWTAIICYWQKRKNIISSYREVQQVRSCWRSAWRHSHSVSSCSSLNCTTIIHWGCIYTHVYVSFLANYH